ncbi:geranylgeranyl reductase family protein [Nocardioides marmoriginsengisoli]|uniref:Geranylgeranyl reductase family protein n=1 Tax=Nocardioides marmoriginsengisoli TaxID=661483 RepID=A0A3N0CCI4_9ACTN|nr:geranylgeranyl reductase family protein [Nocardioides marmoriginsengisoli]RNL61138.1 geranylgeranyl reductase family protein [Nocardioides marmoriginsengisoli]
MTTTPPTRTDVLVVGAGPAGSAAAAWAARAGLDTVLVDAAVFPRDKTCGDGLTPRAIGELARLGLEDWIRAHTVNQGLRAHGFGQTLLLPWPGPGKNGTGLPSYGSAVARTELDDHLRTTAIKAGAAALDGARAVDVRKAGSRVAAVVFEYAADGKRGETFEIECQRLIVADGVRSGLGKVLGREWHRDTVYGVAGRSYIDSGMSDDPWISSHLELRGEKNEILSGYGWIFPLGDGSVNLGVGTLATAKRPAEVALRPLMRHYAELRREDFQLDGDIRMPTSALLPMGGAVSNVAGPNWALIGDAAACVNPLNGEGIDYGLETGRLIVDVLTATPDADLSVVWPELLREHYGEAFSIARRLAGIVTVPQALRALGPIGMRSDWMMTLALRWMGNLVTDEDRDRSARVWRWAGRRSVKLDHRPPFS